MKKLRFKLSPELCDGEHWTIANTTEDAVEMVAMWCESQLHEVSSGVADMDEEATISLVMMSDEEVEALPNV